MFGTTTSLLSSLLQANAVNNKASSKRWVDLKILFMILGLKLGFKSYGKMRVQLQYLLC
jgi:hypothetical protein